MTSKVSLGGGGGKPPAPSSFSSSHLSASAPPFTVGRSNSKPLQYSDFPYASNFAHTWNFANPIPEIQPDEYRGGLESDADSGWSNMNPSAKSTTHQYFYENIPYASPTVENGTPLVTVSDCNYEPLSSTGLESVGFSSQLDYTQSLSGLDYSPQWYGLADAKRGKQAENGGTYSIQKTTTHDLLHHPKQGNSCKCGNIFVNDYCASCGLFSDSIGRESNNGLFHTAHTDNASLLSKDCFYPFGSARVTSLTSEFTDKKSLPLGSSMQSPMKPITYRNPNDPFEKRPQPSGCSVSCSISVTESSPSNVGLGLGLKSIDTNDDTYVPHNEAINNYNISKEEARFALDPGSQAKSHKVDFFSVFPSIIEEPSSCQQAKDTSNSVVKVNYPHAPNLDLSNGCSLPFDTAQTIRSQDKLSDCLEHFNTVIDSPCWKGATAFQLSPFAVGGGEATSHTKQISEHCQLNCEHDLPVKSFFGKTSDDDQVGYGIVFAAAEQRSTEAAKAKTKSPALQASNGVQCPNFSGTEKLVKDDVFISTDPNMVTFDNIKEGGAIAVRAAEDVLSSNSSKDGQIVQPEEKSPPRLDVRMLTNSMKNISELLLSYCSSDTFALKEQDIEAIEDVISNLNGLLPKKRVHLTRTPVPILPQLENSIKSGDSHVPHANTDVVTSEVVLDASVNARAQPDYQPTYEERKNCNGFGEKAQSLQPFLQIRDDLDTFLEASMTQNIGPAVSQVVHNVSVREHTQTNIMPNNEKTTPYDDCSEKDQRLQQIFQIKDDLDVFGDDSMTKSIKKVFDENFNCGEEIQPLAFLFKDLWLESEARLCRFSYKARFDRVKIEMENFKSNQMKESSATSSERDSATKNPQDSSFSDVLTNNAKNGSVQEMVIQSSAKDDNDLETSVMARLKILKGRNSPEFEQRADLAPGLNTDDLANGRSTTCELSPGFIDKSSSDWEHVAKDDAW